MAAKEKDLKGKLEIALRDFETPHAKYGQTTFTVNKMDSWRAWHVLEELRPGLADIAQKIPLTLGIEQIIAAMIIAMPTATVTRAADLLFEWVDFKTPNRGVAIPLKGDEEEAFADLEPFHVYLVLARAFAVNFTQSWRELESMLQDRKRATKPKSTSTSRPSSRPR